MQCLARVYLGRRARECRLARGNNAARRGDLKVSGRRVGALLSSPGVRLLIGLASSAGPWPLACPALPLAPPWSHSLARLALSSLHNLLLASSPLSPDRADKLLHANRSDRLFIPASSAPWLGFPGSCGDLPLQQPPCLAHTALPRTHRGRRCKLFVVAHCRESR